ncbi:hypothetical protein M409DRAFT_51709 [Zasmidium cellare ATCC 36951]|uniref:Uncharacterized protein n=1 Tax=Zasmidium cellare ATCC 36951 TaxID=1080233 RepID=A0A6A6CT78_ZASCE|nr:uncharacterized protein M409DRAFT_51709 [Zasmidium cellare ATCC 36951]KAF2169913.1 hypothetical protein M409DRAFT_51709 [Zasmidium cellare ATCC 36951]
MSHEVLAAQGEGEQYAHGYRTVSNEISSPGNTHRSGHGVYVQAVSNGSSVWRRMMLVYLNSGYRLRDRGPHGHHVSREEGKQLKRQRSEIQQAHAPSPHYLTGATNASKGRTSTTSNTPHLARTRMYPRSPAIEKPNVYLFDALDISRYSERKGQLYSQEETFFPRNPGLPRSSTLPPAQQAEK